MRLKIPVELAIPALRQVHGEVQMLAGVVGPALATVDAGQALSLVAHPLSNAIDPSLPESGPLMRWNVVDVIELDRQQAIDWSPDTDRMLSRLERTHYREPVD
ncbi:hypothetical protein [Fulvimarina sp. MAC3]|uniref:hypothetical protein n=1 Tax=Fulvimarina sp. MAC3 TaxID=3148887 RepID=UPI0031FC8E96